jgi:hypothetical protein
MSSILDSVINASASAAATKTKEETILDRVLREGISKAAAVITHVQDNVPQDRLLRSAAIHFEPAENLVMVGGKNGGSFEQPLTRYALGQAASRVGFPGGYAADVMQEHGAVGRKVVADALSTLWAAQDPTKKVLVRSVNGTVHGVLSDAFRRLDCRPGVDAFCKEAAAVGAVPIDGVVTDTRIAIKAVLPRIFKLHSGAWNDSIAIGIVLRNSDFGAARYSMALYVLRVRCLNGMIGEQLMAQTHVGARLDDADFFSDKTHKLDALTMVSATRDYVRAFLSPEGVEKTVAVLQAAASKKLDLGAELNGALKKAMTKAELQSVTAALQSVNEDEMPLGPPSAYRMSNAISWVAGHTDDADRALDIQRLAGNYLRAA